MEGGSGDAFERAEGRVDGVEVGVVGDDGEGLAKEEEAAG